MLRFSYFLKGFLNLFHYSSCTDKESWILFVNAGQLSVMSETMSKVEKQAILMKADYGNDFILEAQACLYDRYNLELSSAQVILLMTLNIGHCGPFN